MVLDAFERLLWWLFVGSAGGRTRVVVLKAIKEQPRNTLQLSQHLGLDYTTVRHHLRVLEKNGIVVGEGERYGRVFFVSDAMEFHWSKFEAILAKTERAGRGGESRHEPS
jgi:DNA-binding transcriptional ArsR family regulator